MVKALNCKQKKAIQYIFVALTLTFLVAGSSWAIPLTNATVEHTNTYATFKVNGSNVSWYTEYYLKASGYDDRFDAFCVQNTPVQTGAQYELIDIATTSDSQLRNAMLVASNYYWEDTYTYSKTATQIAIWEIMFDSGTDFLSGAFQYNGLQYRDEVKGILDWLHLGFSDTYLDTLMLAQSNNSQDFLITVAAPIPEPASLLLLGTGLIGLIGFGRRKLSNNS